MEENSIFEDFSVQTICLHISSFERVIEFFLKHFILCQIIPTFTVLTYKMGLYSSFDNVFKYICYLCTHITPHNLFMLQNMLRIQALKMKVMRIMMIQKTNLNVNMVLIVIEKILSIGKITSIQLVQDKQNEKPKIKLLRKRLKLMRTMKTMILPLLMMMMMMT